jgi:hypothetical protein
MNQPSISPELPLAPEPERPRSSLASVFVLLGMASALLLIAPVLVQRLSALLADGVRAASIELLLEVAAAVFGALVIGRLSLRALAELYERWRGRRRRRRAPWEELLTQDELDDPALAGFPHLRAAPDPRASATLAARPASLRLVETTPWPLGSGPDSQLRTRKATATKLGFECPSLPPAFQRPAAPVTKVERTRPLPAAPEAREQPVPMPYPFSVWSFHDNVPDEYRFLQPRSARLWLWSLVLMVLATGAAAYYCGVFSFGP